MLENWLKAGKIGEDLQAWQFGANIELFEGDFPDLKDTQVAIIGTGKETDKIRNTFMNWLFLFQK